MDISRPPLNGTAFNIYAVKDLGDWIRRVDSTWLQVRRGSYISCLPALMSPSLCCLPTIIKSPKKQKQKYLIERISEISRSDTAPS